MASARGKVATVEVSSDGSTYYSLGKRVNGSYSITTDILDGTTCDDSAKVGLQGDEQLKLDISGRFDPTDTAQGMLKASVSAKTDLYYRVRERVGSGEAQLVFQGQITDLGVDFGHGNVQELTASVQSTSTITRSTQS